MNLKDVFSTAELKATLRSVGEGAVNFKTAAQKSVGSILEMRKKLFKKKV